MARRSRPKARPRSSSWASGTRACCRSPPDTVPTLRVQPDVEVELRPGETVLECLYRHGYAYRIGCRRGGCGVCKVDLIEGDVRYEANIADEVLPESERAVGTCLTCR